MLENLRIPWYMSGEMFSTPIVTIQWVQAISRKDCRRNEMIEWYLSGFADGEGSFNVSIVNRNQDFKSGWKVAPSFNVSQKDDTVLKIFRRILGCGTIRYRRDGVCYFEVRRLRDLVEKVEPFFTKYPLQSRSKQASLEAFLKILRILERGEHRSREGLKRVLQIRDTMIVGRKRKYSAEQVLCNSQAESSETIRRTLSPSKPGWGSQR